MSIAWVFPGQGSQKIGMLEGILEFTKSKERFEKASNLIGRDLLEMCIKSKSKLDTEDKSILLNSTENTQLALFSLETLLVDMLKVQGSQAQLIAGHSLGELTALYAADVFDIDTGLELVKNRSQLMATVNGGSMLAVIGFDPVQLNKLLKVTDGIVIANDNSASQVVLSGEKDIIQNISQIITCKKAIRLPVSGAFHSPFMNKVGEAFSKILDGVNFRNASVPVLSNIEPIPTCNGYILKQNLKKQMTKSVRWRETMQIFNNQGVSTIIEIGPGNVLSNLCKRNLEKIASFQISNAYDLGL